MKLFITILTLTMVGCAHPPQDGSDDRETAGVSLGGGHQTVFPHPHAHKQGCGHKKITVDGKEAYEHNGEKHIPHAGHVDKK